ncbi:MAG: ParB/RepB/Spo0J family partition protein [Clostridia bacterium]|nr:ParB/RepB/Spo0J family partition protein [Clostridia bacterium]
MRKGLGRGIEALFPEEPQTEDKQDKKTLKLTEIEPNKNQPRKDFDKEKINSLSISIKEHGLIQPIVVTKNSRGRYTIVAGERRWRAAKQAGLKEVPVVINDYSDEEAAQIALIENLQRENLNPIEEARGYKALLEDYNMTQEEVSARIGKSRSAVANSIRLLSLEKSITEKLASGELTGGHARAILSLSDSGQRLSLADKIIENGLNVRQAEHAARQMQKEKKPMPEKRKSFYDIESDALSERLSSKLGTKVSLRHGAKKSKIEIEYYSDSDLERIIEMLGV